VNPFLWILVGFVAVIVVGALVTAGALFERERLQNPDGERGLKWWGALVVSSVMWPFVAGLWPDSRPVPPPQPELMGPVRWREVPPPPVVRELLPDREPLPEDEASMHRVYDFMDKEITPLTSYVWQGQPGAEQADGVFAIDRPTSLALCGRIPPGGKAFVKSLGFILLRTQRAWVAEKCQCQYNFSGFPVVICRQHRSDTDPQGEPDESEGDVGR
jgi:hypothetical protein